MHGDISPGCMYTRMYTPRFKSFQVLSEVSIVHDTHDNPHLEENKHKN